MTTKRELLAGVAGLAPSVFGIATLAGISNASTAGLEAESTLGMDKYTRASDRAVDWLLSRIGPDGGFGPDAVDMTCYHKSAYLLGLAGQTTAANRLLTLIGQRYLQPDGDFMIAKGRKVDKVNYNELTWGYSNGWFALSAHRAGRFDISYPAFQYLQTMRHLQNGGYTSTRPGDPRHPIVELLATAHVGLLALHFGDSGSAASAADVIRQFDLQQSDKSAGLYLRMDADGRFIKTYPEAESQFYFLDAKSPGQFYFVPGYAAAFLCQMFFITGNSGYLSSARSFVDFTSQATGVYETHFSHKLAWGAALLWRITREPRYLDLALRVADFMVTLQDRSGAWFANDPAYVTLDQSAECGIWLRAIPAELST